MAALWDTPHLAEGSPEPIVDPDVITVYNMRFCPFAERTMLVLLQKKLPFRVVNINLSKKPSWFVGNTWGTVSVVRHRGAHIMESGVNSDYIDELFPETRLHPADPLGKAQGRLLVEKFTKMIPKYYGILKAERPEADKLWTEMTGIFEAMDSHLGKSAGAFLCGERVTMADLMVWPWLERIECLGVKHPGMEVPSSLEHLQAWIAAMWGLDSVKQYGIKTENHSKFYAAYLGGGTPDYDMLLKKGA